MTWFPWATPAQLAQLKQEVSKKVAVTQAQLDALASTVDGISTRLGAAVTEIQQEIAALQTANPDLDLSGLQGKVDALGTVASSVEALEVPPAS